MLFRNLTLALALVTTVAATPPAPAPMPQPKVHPAGVPADAIQVSPCIAGMGEHWANPKNLPFGPIYGVYNGKPVFSEVMVDQKFFAAGRSFLDVLAPMPGYTIDHVDIEFVPYGHAGYPIPHYDVHAYYVPHAVHEAFCPKGPREYTAPVKPQ
jgi:hypothetical protein